MTTIREQGLIDNVASGEREYRPDIDGLRATAAEFAGVFVPLLAVADAPGNVAPP